MQEKGHKYSEQINQHPLTHIVTKVMAKLPTFIILLFLYLYECQQESPCTNVLWKSSLFIPVQTSEQLPPKCVQNRVYFNSTGHKFCIVGSEAANPSALECVPEPVATTSLRLPGNVVPVKYHVRLEPDLVKRTTTGYTMIEVLVTSPSRQIVVHANTTILKIDNSRVSMSRKTKNGDIYKSPVDYHIAEVNKDFYRIILGEEIPPNELSGRC